MSGSAPAASSACDPIKSPFAAYPFGTQVPLGSREMNMCVCMCVCVCVVLCVVCVCDADSCCQFCLKGLFISHVNVHGSQSWARGYHPAMQHEPMLEVWQQSKHCCVHSPTDSSSPSERHRQSPHCKKSEHTGVQAKYHSIHHQHRSASSTHVRPKERKEKHHVAGKRHLPPPSAQ
jgi:hypothetical protein